MFRRRPPRRPPVLRRPAGHRPPLPPRARRVLARANRLAADGRFAEAAGILGRLSDEARQRGMLVRAANLALQASRAHFAAGDVDLALERAREAIRLFARGRRAGRIPPFLAQVTATLREKGYDAEADQLEQEAERVLERMGLSLDQVRQQVPQVAEERGTLPPRCSGCGAPLLADEVEWHDARTAECPYCGAAVRAT